MPINVLNAEFCCGEGVLRRGKGVHSKFGIPKSFREKSLRKFMNGFMKIKSTGTLINFIYRRWLINQMGWIGYADWEKYPKIYIHTIGKIPENILTKVINTANDFSTQFKLEFQFMKLPLELHEKLDICVNQNLSNNKINQQNLANDLDNRSSLMIHEALVFVMDEHYSFEKPTNKNEVVEWGYGLDRGIIILRDCRNEVIIHELAHMFGLDHHNPDSPQCGCVMNRLCKPKVFCLCCKNNLLQFRSKIKR